MSCTTGKYRAVVQLRILKFITCSRQVHKDPALAQACALCRAQTGNLVVLGWHSIEFKLYPALFLWLCSTLLYFFCSALFCSFCSAVLCCSFCSTLPFSVLLPLLCSTLLCFILLSFYSVLLSFCSAVLCSVLFIPHIDRAEH